MNLRTPRDIGLAIREKRRTLGLNQEALARQVGVGRQWIVEIEKGKPRAELGLILRTLGALGLALRTEAPRRAPGGGTIPEAAVSIDGVIEAHRGRRGAKR